jgi:PEGA domain
MSRVGLSVVVAAVVGVSLTGCSALSSKSSSEQLQALKFESDPPGAEVSTIQGQTCKTPCELTVPSHEQLVSITKNDYIPQTVQITLGPQPDHSFWENPPPTLAPNPVHVVLHPVSKPVHHVGGRKTHTAKAEPAPSAASSPLPPPPPGAGTNRLNGLAAATETMN